MNEIELEHWGDFRNEVARIRAKFASHRVSMGDGREQIVPNVILFRGQSNSDWTLATTLERATNGIHSVESYLERADSVRNELESTTGWDWKLSTYRDVREEISKCAGPTRVHIPWYEYLVFLRHHGFPSPLLDWTRSPYIAAYFAMEQPREHERCAVYAFIETPDGVKSTVEGQASIKLMGPFVTAHPRHFAQKASYTVCTRWNRDTGQHDFAPHDRVTPDPMDAQDVLIKITIPRRDRVEALRELDDYSINHDSLFRSDDALVRSLAIRAFDIAPPITIIEGDASGE